MTEPAQVPARPLTDFAAAIGFLTLLPMGRTWPEGRMPRSVGWYSWVGWLLGGIAVVPSWLVGRFVAPLEGPRSLVAAALIVTVWAALTRFLHWDGLADAFDGLLGGSTRERRLEIMHDSRIGSFGAMAMLLVALLQVTAVYVLVNYTILWPLLLAPVIGRFSASLAAWELPAARKDGLGLTAMGHAGLYERLVAGAALLALLVVLAMGATTHAFVIVAGVGLVSGLVVPRLLSKPVGGMTGDLFGATVLLVETIVLVTSVVIL